MKKTRVIFLCTGNAARSQMAEAFLRLYAPDQFEVYSAGFDARGIHPYTVKVMEEIGVDVTGHESKNLDQYLGYVHFGITITVCDRAEKVCPTYPSMGTRIYWPFEDPARFEGAEEEKLEKFREVRDKIRERVLEWLDERGIEPAAGRGPEESLKP